MISRQKIKSSLKTDAEIIVYDSVDSTNLQAFKLAESGESRKLLLVADSQTDGKGRQGKSFYSPADTGLYLSVLIHPNTEFANVVTFTSAAAVAVVRAIESATPLEPKIKWVNDIYLNDKKVGGILAQNIAEHGKITSMVIGVGINISTHNFPDELQGIADSLNCNIDREELAVKIADNIFTLTANPQDRSYMAEYKEKSCVIGKEIKYYENGNAHSTTAVDITDDGGLVVRVGSETKILTSGEITVRAVI